MALWYYNDNNTHMYSIWDGETFDLEPTPEDIGAPWRIIAGAAAPTHNEKIVIGIDNDANINGQMWDGDEWTALPFNPLASVSESFWWGFGVAYEQQSGDAMLVWNDGNLGNSSLTYRVWNGATWSDEFDITTPSINGEAQHMKIAARPHSDEMVLVVSNNNSQDYALVWNGSSWGNIQQLTLPVIGDARTDVYVAYEQQSGQALVVYGEGSTDALYRVWNGASWSAEGVITAPLTTTGNVRWATLGADPSSDRIALGVLTFDQEAWLSVWDGAAWETAQTATDAAPGNTFPGVAVAFESQSGAALATYGGNSDWLRYRVWNSGVGWSAEQEGPYLGNRPNSMMLDAAPHSDHIMLLAQDANNDLNQALWRGESWGGRRELESDTGGIENQPFIFLWNQYTPEPVKLGSALSAAPTLLSAGDCVTVSLFLTASEQVTGVTPSGLSVSGENGVSADLVSGPSPASATVDPAGSTFTWVYQVSSAGNVGQLTWSGGASNGINAVFARATSNSVIVAPPLSFAVTVDDPMTASVIENVAYIQEDSAPPVPSNLVQNVVTPPTLSYKSKAQQEREERERREREEAERREAERLAAERAAAQRAAEAERARALSRPPEPAPETIPPAPEAPAPAPAPAPTPSPTRDETPRPSAEDPRSLVMFEEDGLAPTRREIDDIEMLGGPEEEVEEEEVEEEEAEEGPTRRPPRPPKSPDMRPVYAGFILVFVGLAQFIWGVLAMVGSPTAATGPWSPLVQWGAFSMGLTAAFLGLLAMRGGLWSFRKENFSVVKIGAIAATIAVWAWWIPWLFGLAALVIITKARDEYYPFYDPRWDAPEWARPPTSEEESGGDEGDGEEAHGEDGPVERPPKDSSARDFLDDGSPPDDKEASGLQDADVSTGDGWEDLA
jgi:hypothetical protein